MPPNATVYLVDDERCLLDSLGLELSAEGLYCKTYTSAQAFLRDFDHQTSGCLVADVCMPDMTGLDLLKEVRGNGSALPIIFLTAYPDVRDAVQAIKVGAVDYLEKNGDHRVLVSAIRLAMKWDEENRRIRTERAGILARLASLTRRQREVMDHVVGGRSSKETAQRMKLCKKTVESHRTHVMHKMQAHSVAELVRMVFIATMSENLPRHNGSVVAGLGLHGHLPYNHVRELGEVAPACGR